LKKVNIVLVGIGGYGANYVRDLLQDEEKYPCTVVGAVDPYPDNSPVMAVLTERGIPIYPTLEAFYASGQTQADLTIISSPIQFHCAQTCLALSHGSHVLCEKPVSASLEDAHTMIRARDQAGKTVAIGYQWSFSNSILSLKRDIADGLFGKPKRLRTIVLWPRSDRYYARGWAGKLRDQAGNLIMDSVANNATAHYIHNMFFVLGQTMDESARPARVTAELYRANRIENFDTAAMRVHTEDGTELLYYGAHPVRDRVGAMFHYEFELADITYDQDSADGIVARFRDGSTRTYGNPNRDDEAKLRAAIDAARGEGEVVCGVETALSHTICVLAMQQSTPAIVEFPEEIVRRGELLSNGEAGNYVEGLVAQLVDCYERGVLPAEAGLSWAQAGKEIVV